MCQYLSALVVPNGDVIYNDATDSHEDLVQWAGLVDDGKERFARVEFAPKAENDLPDINKYVFKLDQDTRPSWFSDELEKQVVARLRVIAERNIITKDNAFLLGGVWVVSGSFRVAVKNGRVEARDSSIVTAFGSSIVTACDSSSVKAFGSSSVTAFGSSSVVACTCGCFKGTITDMRK